MNCFASQTKSAHRRGLTLIELVVTVLIIGIMAAVAVPKYADTLHRYRAEAAAKRVAADLNLARRQALVQSASQTVQFSIPTADSYTLTGMADLNRSASEYVVDLSDSPYKASVVSAVFGADADIVFNGYGIPDSGGTVVVQSGPYQTTVTVNAETGKASVP